MHFNLDISIAVVLTTRLTNHLSYRYKLPITKILLLLKIYLEWIGSLGSHQRNIESLGIELFKVKGNLANNVMYNILHTRTINYNLRSKTNFTSNCVNTDKFSLNLLRYFASKV